MPKHLRKSSLPLSIAVLAASNCYAQAVPDAGQILQQQQQSPGNTPERLPRPEVAPVRPEFSAPSGTAVVLRKISFQGGEGLASEAELQAQVADALSKSLGLAQLQLLADRITQFLKAKGWFLARAYLPEQDITDGTIEITILPGRVEGGASGLGLKLETQLSRLPQERIRKTVAQALFKDAEANNTGVHSLKLERAILLLNDLPGINARATLEKGDEPGSTRVVVTATEGPMVSGNVSADNQGNRYTGTARVNAQVAVNSPLGLGDQATLSLSAAERLSQAGLGYSLPLGHDGWRFSIAHYALRYRIGKEFESTQSKGTADTTQLGMSYPFIRSREQNLYGRLGYEHKALYDEQLGSAQRDRRIDNISLSLSGDSYDQWHGGGLLNYGLTLTQGNADLSRIASDVSADANARAAGSFSRLNFNVARLQKLNDKLSLSGALSGQMANQNLVSSEKFLLGGPNGVRAYPMGEASGDAGLLGTVEVRYDVPGLYAGGNLQLQSFVDAGQITLSKEPWAGSTGNATSSNRYTIAGAGVGVSLSRLGAWNLRAIWATKIGSNPGRTAVTNRDADGLTDRSRFWLNAMLWF